MGLRQESDEKTDEGVIDDRAQRASGQPAKSKEIKRAHIVYVFDNNYAPIGGVSITSLFENNQDIDEMTVYILSEGFSEENEKRFAQLAQMYNRKIVCMNVSEKIEEYKSMGLKPYRRSYVPYLKMFFPDFFSEDIERMIYIDADTVVLRSIASLLETDALLGMVKHSVVTFTGKTAGYDAPFNSEVMVFDTSRWRKEEWSKKILEFVRENGANYLAADEGILNMVCREEIVKLPLGYAFDVIFCAMPKEDFLAAEKNMYYTPEEIALAYDEPIVIHMGVFFGEKPWQEGNMHPAKEYFDIWLARSLWKDYAGPAINSSSVFAAEKWLYKKLPKRLFYIMWLVSQKYCVRRELKRLRSAGTE